MNFKVNLIVLGVFIVGGAGIVYFVFMKFYRKELLLRLSPLTENENLVASNRKFWFLGDSRVYQWNITDEAIPKNQYCNLGVNTQTSAQVYYRLKIHLEQALPEYVFVQVGINDIKAIGVFPENKERILRNCIENIESIINTCQSYKVRPIYCTILPAGNVQLARLPIWTNEINNAVIFVNKEITNFCKLKGVSIFDTYSALVSTGGTLLKKYQEDDLHVNKAGYDYLNVELVKFLKIEKIANK